MHNGDILVIDDDEQMRKLLSIALQSNNYKVMAAGTGEEGLLHVANHAPDLVLLDLALPHAGSYNILKHLREWYKKPIILLSEPKNEEEIVAALDAGGDDYLVKPIRTNDLLARVRSALNKFTTRRNNPVLTYEDLTIDFVDRTVMKRGIPVILDAKEYSALTLMIKNAGMVLTQRSLLQQIWGSGHLGDSQYLIALIAQLRKKIEKDPTRPQYILTESGIGYRFIGNTTT